MARKQEKVDLPEVANLPKMRKDYVEGVKQENSDKRIFPSLSYLGKKYNISINILRNYHITENWEGARNIFKNNIRALERLDEGNPLIIKINQINEGLIEFCDKGIKVSEQLFFVNCQEQNGKEALTWIKIIKNMTEMLSNIRKETSFESPDNTDLSDSMIKNAIKIEFKRSESDDNDIIEMSQG